MSKKILIVSADPEEKMHLDKALSSVVEEGGELFFAGVKQEALDLIEREHPQLLFLEESFLEEESFWKKKCPHVFFLCKKRAETENKKDCLFKPFKERQIHAIYQEVFSQQKGEFVPPPM